MASDIELFFNRIAGLQLPVRFVKVFMPPFWENTCNRVHLRKECAAVERSLLNYQRYYNSKPGPTI